ncbi:MAG: kelch repeat-containing protein [Kofleriaceae bacterium]
MGRRATRRWDGIVVATALAVVAGCLADDRVTCDDGSVCGAGQACVRGGADGCATAGELAACAGLVDGATCDAGFGAGRCRAGACRAASCGDGVVDPDEACDDGNTLDGDGCARRCDSDETCGNGVRDDAAGELCDDGAANSVAPDAACRPTCQPSGCGDGVIDPLAGERCDDGGGNSLAPSAACRPTCQPARCGDGVVDDDEVCDDGNVLAADGCASDCGSDETCGNGVLDVAAGEECDAETSSCRSDCTIARCGDGILDAANGERCDAGLANSLAPGAPCRPSCQLPRCGDGILDPGEVCDDGGVTSGDGCSADCRSDETCGNGYLDLVTGEQCDLDPTITHDGCTSTCGGELAGWNAWTSDYYDRVAHAAAYDQRRDRVVVFGGHRNFVPGARAETLEWDGAGWQRRGPPRSPAARSGAAMAYDEVRQVVVLFGGVGPTGYLADTWEYDGATWQAQPGPGPSPRSGHTLVYDGGRQRLVLFGGDAGDGELADTWERDSGGAWQLVAPTTSPPPMSGHAAAYDPDHARVVVVRGGAWSYDGTSWTYLVTAGDTPPTLNNAAMAYDADRAALILHGGTFFTAQGDEYALEDATWSLVTATVNPGARAKHTLTGTPDGLLLYGGTDSITPIPEPPGGGEAQQTWRHGAGGWADVSPGTRPSARRDLPLAYDAWRGRLVAFGGRVDATTYLAETWEFVGDWWERRGGASPSARARHGAAFALDRGELVIFGGEDAHGRRDDTWSWDGATWRQATPATRPTARAGLALADDPARARLVLFGGRDATGPRDDTWAWDGLDWAEVSSTIAPPAREDHGLAYDPVRAEVVLFGGRDATGLRDDTWVLDTDGWRELTPTTAPPPAATALAYEAARGRVVAVVAGRLWELARTPDRWIEAAPTSLPPSTAAHGLAYDGVRRSLAMVAGVLTSSGTATDAVSTFAYLDPAEPGEACADATADTDGDGLPGCADPDCWAMCTPACPPATSCVATMPACGDGACAEWLEDPARCPEDCAP